MAKYIPCISPNGHDLVMMKSTSATPADGDWTQTDGAIKPFLGRGYNAIQDPIKSVWADFGTVGGSANVIAVSYQQESGRVGFSAFDTDTDTWDIFDEEVTKVGDASFDFTPLEMGVSIGLKASGDEVVLFNIIREDRSTDRDDVAVWSRSSGGTWTVRDASIGSAATLEIYGPAFCGVDGSNNQVFSRNRSTANGINKIGYAAADAAPVSDDQADNTHDTALFVTGRGVYDGANFVVPYLDASDKVSLAEYSSHTDTTAVISADVSANTVENNGAASAPFPAFCLAYDSGNSETVLAYIRDSDGDVYVATDLTGTPTGDGTALVAATGERISCEYASTATELWIVYDDAGTLKFVLKSLAAGAPTGTGAIALVELAISGTAHMDPEATGALALIELAIAGAGIEEFTATGALEIIELAIAATAAHEEIGAGALELIDLAIAGAGLQIFTATGALALVDLAISGAGEQPFEGQGALALIELALTGTGVMQPSAVGALEFIELVVNGTGQVPFEGQGALEFVELALAGVGDADFVATGALEFIELAINGTGVHGAFEGTGALEFIELAIAATAAHEEIGSGALALVELAIAGTGVQIFTAVGALEFIDLALAGTGAHEEIGAGALEFVELVIAGTGEQPFEGVGALALIELAISGSGLQTMTATGSLEFIELAIAGTGVAGEVGAGALELIELVIGGTGVQIITSTGALEFSELEISGTGVAGEVGAGVLELIELVIAGTGVQTSGISGVGALELIELVIDGTGVQVLTSTGALEFVELVIDGVGYHIDPSDYFNPRLTDRTYEERARDLLVKDSLNPFSAYNIAPPARKKIIVPN